MLFHCQKVSQITCIFVKIFAVNVRAWRVLSFYLKLLPPPPTFSKNMSLRTWLVEVLKQRRLPLVKTGATGSIWLVNDEVAVVLTSITGKAPFSLRMFSFINDSFRLERQIHSFPYEYIQHIFTFLISSPLQAPWHQLYLYICIYHNRLPYFIFFT